jgi:hypothetical protein
MKKTLIICLSLLAVASCATQTHASAVIKSVPTGGLAAYWPFDGNSINWGTNTVFDKSGNGYNGTPAFMSASGNSVAGKVGQALYFNGSVTSVGLSSIPLTNTSSPSSACAWANSANTALTSGGYNQTIMDLYVDGNNGVRIGNVSGSFFASYQVGGASKGAQTTAGVFTNNSWAFVCYVWDGGGMTLYANGVSVATTTNIDSVGSPSEIGAHDDGGGGVWDGNIDEVRVYTRALTAAEVLRIYQSSVATIDKVAGGKVKIDVTPENDLSSGLVGYWSFDGKTMDWAKSQAKDLSGAGNTGQLIKMSTTTSPVMGKIGQAMSFNGTNSYVDVPYNPSFAFERTNTFSVSAWVKVTSTALPTGCIDGIFGNIASDGYTGYLGDILLPGSGSCAGGDYSGFNANSVMFDLDNTADGLLVMSPANSFKIGVWQYVTETYDGSSLASGCKIYINGVLQPNSIIYNNLAHSIVSPGDLEIGNDNTGDFMTGSIDDVRIYNRVLSASEVRQLYLMGK